MFNGLRTRESVKGFTSAKVVVESIVLGSRKNRSVKLVAALSRRMMYSCRRAESELRMAPVVVSLGLIRERLPGPFMRKIGRPSTPGRLAASITAD